MTDELRKRAPETEAEYIEWVYAHADAIVGSGENLASAAQSMVMVPVQLDGIHEPTFYTAIPEEFGGGVRIDPTDAYALSPSDVWTAHDAKCDYLRTAMDVVAHDLKAAQKGDLQ